MNFKCKEKSRKSFADFIQIFGREKSIHMNGFSLFKNFYDKCGIHTRHNITFYFSFLMNNLFVFVYNVDGCETTKYKK